MSVCGPLFDGYGMHSFRQPERGGNYEPTMDTMRGIGEEGNQALPMPLSAPTTGLGLSFRNSVGWEDEGPLTPSSIRPQQRSVASLVLSDDENDMDNFNMAMVSKIFAPEGTSHPGNISERFRLQGMSAIGDCSLSMDSGVHHQQEQLYLHQQHHRRRHHEGQQRRRRRRQNQQVTYQTRHRLHIHPSAQVPENCNSFPQARVWTSDSTPDVSGDSDGFYGYSAQKNESIFGGTVEAGGQFLDSRSPTLLEFQCQQDNGNLQQEQTTSLPSPSQAPAPAAPAASSVAPCHNRRPSFEVLAAMIPGIPSGLQIATGTGTRAQLAPSTAPATAPATSPLTTNDSTPANGRTLEAWGAASPGRKATVPESEMHQAPPCPEATAAGAANGTAFKQAPLRGLSEGRDRDIFRQMHRRVAIEKYLRKRERRKFADQVREASPSRSRPKAAAQRPRKFGKFIKTVPDFIPITKVLADPVGVAEGIGMEQPLSVKPEVEGMLLEQVNVEVNHGSPEASGEWGGGGLMGHSMCPPFS